jgi:hypothetical protein
VKGADIEIYTNFLSSSLDSWNPWPLEPSDYYNYSGADSNDYITSQCSAYHINEVPCYFENFLVVIFR